MPENQQDMPALLTDTGTKQKKTKQMDTPLPIRIAIRKEPIRLSQFLKLANLVQDGLEAKIRITEGEVLVNGSLETRRGRKLFCNDQVQLNNEIFEVVKSEKQ